MTAQTELKITTEAFLAFVNRPENAVFPALPQESQTQLLVQA